MRVVIALGVVFLSGCVTQQLQHTLDDAVKIEAACAAVDNVLPNSGPTVSELKKQIASRFIPPSCELQNGGINWGSDGCFAIVSEITSDTELDLGSTAKELQAIKSDATKLKPDIDSAVAALDEMFAGIKADTNFCSSSQKIGATEMLVAQRTECARQLGVVLQVGVGKVTNALVNLQTDVEHLQDRVHRLRETVGNDPSLAAVVPAVTHLDQEATALVTYLRGATEAFNALSSQNNTTIVDEFFAPRLYVFLAKESLDVIENSLRPLDRLVERVDDRFFFAASASLYVFQGSIQDTIDRFYQEQVVRHYPDASMQLAFASAACQRLHDPQIANGAHPSMFAPFVERMFADVDASMIKESKSSSASGGGKSSVGSTSPATHRAPPPTPKADVAASSPGALDHVEVVSAEVPGRGSGGGEGSSTTASAPDPSSASHTELAVPKTWDVAGFTKDLQAYRSHVRGVRGAVTDADRVAQCSAAKFEAARLQAASEGVTDGDAHTVAIAACGQNIFGQEAAVGQASLKGRTDTPAGDVHPVTGADVSAIARIYYTRLSLTAIQNTQVNVSQHVRLEMPPRNNVANDQKTGLCSVVSVAGSACYAAGESVRVEVRKSFGKGDWHNNDIDGILTQIADQLSGTGSQYVIAVTGFASSATAAPRRLGLPAQLLANYNRCIGQSADGNKQLSCARAVWAFDVLIKRGDNLVSRDLEKPDISGAAATRSSSVDAPADRRVEIWITPLATGQPRR